MFPEVPQINSYTKLVTLLNVRFYFFYSIILLWGKKLKISELKGGVGGKYPSYTHMLIDSSVDDIDGRLWGVQRGGRLSQLL